MSSFRNWSVKAKLSLLVGVSAAGLAILAGRGFQEIDRVKVYGPLYHQIINEKDFIADFLPPALFLVEPVFLQESPVRLSALHGMVGMGRPSDVANITHALKGAARSLGLVRMAACCQVIESLGKEGRLPDKAAFARLETEYASVTGVLEPLRTPRG